MDFKIKDIIENQDLIIKTLTYQPDTLKDYNLGIFNKEDLERFSSFGCEKRQAEFYYTRKLWQQFSAHQNIYYNKIGKPTLKKGFISISHSKNVVSIAYSPSHQVGLDIEHFNPKIYRIRNKFLSEMEIAQHNIENPETITTLWSIKEAVYKLMGIKGLSFKNAIHITKVGDINEVLVENKELELVMRFSRITFKDYILTYCTDNSNNTPTH